MLEALGVDYAQLLTHAVGFLITLWILKRFAWGPILALMDERREKIAGEFAKIEQDKADVADLTDRYDAKLSEIDAERRARLVEAVDEGKKIAEEIKLAAQQAAREQADKAKLDLEREVAKAKVQLKNEMVAITIAAAEKVINEKLDDAKHRDLIGDFIDNLEKA